MWSVVGHNRTANALSIFVLIVNDLHQADSYAGTFRVADGRVDCLGDKPDFIDHRPRALLLSAPHNFLKSLHEVAIQ
jgi:hypothetical protein